MLDIVDELKENTFFNIPVTDKTVYIRNHQNIIVILRAPSNIICRVIIAKII